MYNPKKSLIHLLAFKGVHRDGWPLISKEPNPYREEEEEEMMSIFQKDGWEIWTDISDKVIQYGCKEDLNPIKDRSSDLTVTDLREIAQEMVLLLADISIGYLTSLSTLEANDRKTVYFFRWEDLSEPLSETVLPPFVQVGLDVDGSLIGYTNTLKQKII